MNHTSVPEYVKRRECISCYAVVTKYIFGRMR